MHSARADNCGLPLKNIEKPRFSWPADRLYRPHDLDSCSELSKKRTPLYTAGANSIAQDPSPMRLEILNVLGRARCLSEGLGAGQKATGPLGTEDVEEEQKE